MAFHSTLLRSRDLRNWFESQPLVISANANRDKAVAAQEFIPNSEVSADVKAKHERDTAGWTDCNISDMDLCEVGNNTLRSL